MHGQDHVEERTEKMHETEMPLPQEGQQASQKVQGNQVHVPPHLAQKEDPGVQRKDDFSPVGRAGNALHVVAHQGTEEVHG